MATSGSIVAGLTDSTNRGTIFGQVQMMTNFGRMVGPVVAGHLAMRDPIVLPWVFSGVCSTLSGAMLLMLCRASTSTSEKKDREKIRMRGFSTLQDCPCELEDEVGSAEDYQKVGRTIGDLLMRRHYRWVSKQDAVLEMIDRLLPELRMKGDEQFQDLQQLSQHVQAIEIEFSRIGDRQM